MPYMITQALLDFVAGQIKRGIKEETIKGQLTDHGWSEEEVKRAIQAVAKRDPHNEMLKDMAFPPSAEQGGAGTKKVNTEAGPTPRDKGVVSAKNIPTRKSGQGGASGAAGGDEDASEYSGLKVALSVVSILGLILLGIVVVMLYPMIESYILKVLR